MEFSKKYYAILSLFIKKKRLLFMAMITTVFKHPGDVKTVASAYKQLMDLHPNDKNKKQKAAGSLGGASNGKSIRFKNGKWKRVR